MTEENKIVKQLEHLDKWFENNDYQGYDIYDLFDVKLFHNLITNKPLIVRKINRKVIQHFINLFPNFIIKIFDIKKNINPKAMGLLLKGYCNFYKITSQDIYKNKAIKIASWLLNNKSAGLRGYGWGYPFNWSGSKFIPKYTPSSVVTAIVGDGLYNLFKITNDLIYIDACKNICNFFIYDLNIDKIDKEKICFSYTPIDNDHVHNANLFASEFLIRIGKEFSEKKFVDYGIKAVNYTINEQNSDGSIFYWGIQDNRFLKFTFSKIDHYHAGFELRKLWCIMNLLNETKIKISFDKYYTFYRNNLIGNKFFYQRPQKTNPINIHSCAEFIICNSIIYNGINLESKWFKEIFNKICNEMLDKDGLFKFEVRKYSIFKIQNKFKFFRWSQAWMFLALSEYLFAKKVNE